MDGLVQDRWGGYTWRGGASGGGAGRSVESFPLKETQRNPWTSFESDLNCKQHLCRCVTLTPFHCHHHDDLQHQRFLIDHLHHLLPHGHHHPHLHHHHPGESHESCNIKMYHLSLKEQQVLITWSILDWYWYRFKLICWSINKNSTIFSEITWNGQNYFCSLYCVFFLITKRKKTLHKFLIQLNIF